MSNICVFEKRKLRKKKHPKKEALHIERGECFSGTHIPMHVVEKNMLIAINIFDSIIVDFIIPIFSPSLLSAWPPPQFLFVTLIFRSSKEAQNVGLCKKAVNRLKGLL